MKILTQNLILTLNPQRLSLFLLKDFHKSSRVVFQSFTMDFSCQIPTDEKTTINLWKPWEIKWKS